MSDETYKELREKFIKEIRDRKSQERQCYTTLTSAGNKPFLSRLEDTVVHTNSTSSLIPLQN